VRLQELQQADLTPLFPKRALRRDVRRSRIPLGNRMNRLKAQRGASQHMRSVGLTGRQHGRVTIAAQADILNQILASIQLSVLGMNQRREANRSMNMHPVLQCVIPMHQCYNPADTGAREDARSAPAPGPLVERAAVQLPKTHSCAVKSLHAVVGTYCGRSGDPGGKPVIRGTRLAVEFILELLAAGQSEPEILRNYPGLTRDDLLACLSYASYLAHEYKAYPIPA